MKKEQGFTLVELLIVISIIGLVLLLVIPSIMGAQNKAEKNRYTYYRNALVEAGKVYEVERVHPEISGSSWHGCVQVTVQELEQANLLKNFHTDKLTCEGGLGIEKEEGRNQYDYRPYLTCTENGKEVYKIDERTNSSCSVTVDPDDTTIKDAVEDTILVETPPVVNGDGLYEDTIDTGLNPDLPWSSEYYYRGANPHNFLIYSNVCWSIINIAQNHALKMVYEGPVNADGSCTRNSSTGHVGEMRWAEVPSFATSRIHNTMKTWLESGNINNVFTLDKSKIVTATWYIGDAPHNSTTSGPKAAVARERASSMESAMGLINISDYGKATLSSACGAFSPASETLSCGSSNYLSKQNGYNYWSINGNVNVWWFCGSIDRYMGGFNYSSGNSDKLYVRPTVYLTNKVKLEGNGSAATPFKVIG